MHTCIDFNMYRITVDALFFEHGALYLGEAAADGFEPVHRVAGDQRPDRGAGTASD